MRGLGVLGRESIYFIDDDVVLAEEWTIFLIRTVLGEVPARSYGEFVKFTEYGLFLFVRDSHVILDGVQTAQNEIVHANL